MYNINYFSLYGFSIKNFIICEKWKEDNLSANSQFVDIFILEGGIVFTT